MPATDSSRGTHFAPPGEISEARAQGYGQQEPAAGEAGLGEAAAANGTGAQPAVEPHTGALPQAAPPAQVRRTVSVGRSSAIMAAGTLLSRLLGFIKVALIGLAIGATANVSDIFETANNLPNQLYIMLAGGVFNVVLVPQIIKASKAPDRGADYLSRLLTLGVIFLGSVTIILTLFSGPIIHLLTNDWTSAQLGLGAQFSIWLMPQIFFYGLYALLGQALNAHDKFGAYMWAPVVNNIVAIAGLGVFIAVFGAGGSHPHNLDNWTATQTIVLTGTTTLGVVIQSLVLLWPVRKLGLNLRPKFGWRGMGLGASGKIAGWALGAMVIGQISFLFISRVATTATAAKPDGGGGADWPGIFVFSRASDIYLLPHSIIVLSVATVLFNQMARASQAKDRRGLQLAVSRLFRTVGVATMFAGVALLVVSGQLGYLLGGESRQDGHALGIAIAILAISSPFLSIHFMANRVFYAQEDARWPFILQAILVVFGIGTAIIVSFFPPSILIYALVTTEALGNILGPFLSLSVLNRKIGGFEFGRVLRAHVQYLVAALLAGVVGVLVLAGMGGLSFIGGGYTGFAWRSHVAAIITIVVIGVLMAVVYGLALWLMRVAEFVDLLAPIVGRLAGMAPFLRPAAARLNSHQLGSEANASPRHGRVPDAGTEEETLANPVEVGSVLGGRYKINTHVLVSAEGDHVLDGVDQVLHRPVSILVTGAANSATLAESAREIATGTRSAPFQILDLGSGEEYSYLVTSKAQAPDLLDLLIATEPFIEPNFTDALGMEIFGSARPAASPGDYEYVYEDNSPVPPSQLHRAQADSPFNQDDAERPANAAGAPTSAAAAAPNAPRAAIPPQPNVAPGTSAPESNVAPQSSKVQAENIGDQDTAAAQNSAGPNTNAAQNTDAARPNTDTAAFAAPLANEEGERKASTFPPAARGTNSAGASATGTSAAGAAAAAGSGAAGASAVGASRAAASSRGTSVPAPAESEPEFDDDSRNAPKTGRWLVGGVLILILIVAVVIAVSQLGRGGGAPAADKDSSSVASSAAGSPSAQPSASSAPPAAPAQPVSVKRLVGPGGDPGLSDSDDANLKNVIDGNPATAWTSLQFASPDFGRLTKSMALAVELKQSTDISSVTVSQVGATGGNFQVLTNDQPSLDGANMVGNGSFTGSDVTVGVNPGSKGKYVIINFTELPKLTNNTLPNLPYGLKISEVAIK